ncbi:MAG: N-acetylmuramoyl-L-alanine amidase [Muribaculaceae bacterium]|nr:N-acetylmuramoyl-L-alanine amidase [Muribaculaceae bacterium]
MKKQSLLLMMACAGILGASAGNGIKVYINPGHGGHDSDDRNVVIEPYKQGDPEGYWESNSNLEKGLALRDILLADGYSVEMSRVTNTTADDLGLSTISSLANKYQADIFFSIHSNATGTTARRNFPLMLYRGYDNDPVKPEDKVVAGILNKHLLENEVTYWTSTATNCRGDWDFYKSWGTSGLGVLRGLTVTGMLSEGSFHDYIPEAYRLMSKDFCWLEAYHFRRTIDEYFNQPGETVGHIFGRLNDSRSPRPGTYMMFGDDTYATIQNATVELYDADGKLLDTYTTDPIHVNGVYGFKNLQPGTYTVKTKVDTHYDDEATVVVEADRVTYANFKLNKVRSTAPEVLAYSPVWNEGDEGVLCNAPIVFDFNWDMDTEATAAAFSIEPAVKGTITWEDLNYRMVFTPSEPYNISTKYTVTLSTAAAHPGNMNLAEPLVFSFLTTDRNFMDIIGQSPKAGESVHYKNAAVEFRFDKRPNFNKLPQQISCKDEDGNTVLFNTRSMTTSKASLSYGYFRVPFTNELVPGKSYTIHLDGELADNDGLTIKEPVDVTFKACDAGTEKEGGLISEIDNHAVFAYNEEQSAKVKSQKLATDSKTALFSKAVNFTYTFEDNEGGEILWNTSEENPTTVTTADIITVHINGDLSENGLYFLFSSETAEKFVHVADLNFIGWRTFDVPMVELEGDAPYTFRGVKVVQNAALQSSTGTIGVDRVYLKGSAGVENVEVGGLTVKVTPDYVVANADCMIESVALVDLQGRTVATTKGNALYLGGIGEGHYIALVNTAQGRSARRIVINR